jgi:hypothetical protein
MSNRPSPLMEIIEGSIDRGSMTPPPAFASPESERWALVYTRLYKATSLRRGRDETETPFDPLEPVALAIERDLQTHVGFRQAGQITLYPREPAFHADHALRKSRMSSRASLRPSDTRCSIA